MSETKKGKPISQKCRDDRIGRRHSIESREKMSLAKRGVTFSDQHKENIKKNHAHARFGVSLSDDHKTKIKNALIAYHTSKSI